MEERLAMEGVALGVVGGFAFGLFQATNRRANRDADPYLATFTVIVVSLVLLAMIAAVFEEPTRLLRSDARVVAMFAAAGLGHFFVGWTLLSLAQQRIGASRTGVVTGAAPLFGTAIAFVFIGESVRPVALLGVLLVVAGVALLASNSGRQTATSDAGVRTGWIFAGLTALAWGASPTLIRHALTKVPMPLSGVMVGMAAAATAYGAALLVRRTRRRDIEPLSGRSIATLVIAGALVATGIGTQWLALDLAPVAIVLALNQLAVPVVLVAAPLIVGMTAERLTWLSVVGAALTVAGTVVIIVSRA